MPRTEPRPAHVSVLAASNTLFLALVSDPSLRDKNRGIQERRTPVSTSVHGSPGCQTITSEMTAKGGRRKDKWEFMFTLVSVCSACSSMCYALHPHPPPPTNMGKSSVPTPAVQERHAGFSATQASLHGALLCIEQPRFSTVSLHHPASPHSPLRLTRLKCAVDGR